MMKRFIWVPLFLVMAVCAGTAGAEPLIDGDVEAGQKKAAVCAGCHGLDGNSMSAQFPKLADQGAPYLYEQLKLFKSGKRDNPIMMAQAQALSEQDMKDLAAYFAVQQIKPGVVPNPKLAQTGAVIYHGGKPEANVPACSGCHGPAGLGNPAARYPRISGQHAEYIVQELEAYRSGERGGYPRAKVMQGVAQGLSDADIKALAAYITGLMPAEPGSINTSGALMQDLPEPEPEAAPPEDGAAPAEAPASEEGAPAPDDAPAVAPENGDGAAVPDAPPEAEEGGAAEPVEPSASEDRAPAPDGTPAAQPEAEEAGAAETAEPASNSAGADTQPAEEPAEQRTPESES